MSKLVGIYGVSSKTCCKNTSGINPNYYSFREFPVKGTIIEYNRKVSSGPIRENEFHWGIPYQDKVQNDRRYRPTVRALHHLPCSRDPAMGEKNKYPTRHWDRS